MKKNLFPLGYVWLDQPDVALGIDFTCIVFLEIVFITKKILC